jgi:hypothetical protein
MSALGGLFGSLRSMDEWQLLLAFVACIAYVSAQGALLSSKGRTVAWGSAAVSAFIFACRSADWTQSTMLFGFAVAGLGAMTAVVWLMSLALGIAASPTDSTHPAPAHSVAAAPDKRARPHAAAGAPNSA